MAIATVVLGLVLEYGPEFFHAAKARSCGLPSVGAILVVLGVSGELGLHVASSQVVTKIRGIQREIDTAQRTTIAEITKQSAEASERAANAEQRAAEARAEVARANENAANAQKQTAQLELALEKERQARLPRSIGRDQREKLIAALKSAPKGKVFVIGSFFDAESTQFANEISQILKDAGFEISDMLPRPNRPIGYNQPGAWLWVNDVKQAPPHARPIQDNFKEAGVYLDGQSHPDLVQPDEVLIAVSSHP
ncbi:hypothetical protein [Bradyrhizobium sp. HKCCYLRH2057]|uniref:hypothetical protein n=1 Tax=unclassified Bradyrhizobium TaxID=2631580 RepID=UPI003EBB678D